MGGLDARQHLRSAVHRRPRDAPDDGRSGIEYMIALADWYTRTTEKHPVGFFQIGGGIAGDFPICVVPMLHQDLGREQVPLWAYFCQISDRRRATVPTRAPCPTRRSPGASLASRRRSSSSSPTPRSSPPSSSPTCWAGRPGSGLDPTRSARSCHRPRETPGVPGLRRADLAARGPPVPNVQDWQERGRVRPPGAKCCGKVREPDLTPGVRSRGV